MMSFCYLRKLLQLFEAVVEDTSIIIVTYKRARLLETCLNALPRCEVIVVINGADEETKDLLKNYPTIKKIFLSQRLFPAKARNLAAHFANKDWLLFLDDDVSFPTAYFLKAERLKMKGVSIFGGPDETKNSAGIFEKSLGFALSSFLTTGPTHYRHQKNKEEKEGTEKNLILCHLWVKRELFLKTKFDERFYRNEENIFLMNLPQEKILYSGDLFVYHERKTHVAKLFLSSFKSGKYRMQGQILFPTKFEFIFCIPLLALCYFIFSLFHFYFFIPCLIFLVLSLLSAFIKSKILWPLIFFYQLLINFAYAVGSFVGLVFLFRKKK